MKQLQPVRFDFPGMWARGERMMARFGDIPVLAPEDDPDVPGSPAWHRARFAEHEDTNLNPLFADAATDLPVIRAWVKQYLANPRGASSLLLTGHIGTGKTHAAWAALRMIGQSGRPFVRWRATSSAEWFAAMRPPATDSEGVFSRFAHAPLLFLDDLGAEKPSEWTHAMWLRLFDDRGRYKLPGIYTTNYGPGGLSVQIGDRVRSRLAEMTGPEQQFHVRIEGPDRRRRAA